MKTDKRNAQTNNNGASVAGTTPSFGIIAEFEVLSEEEQLGVVGGASASASASAGASLSQEQAEQLLQASLTQVSGLLRQPYQ